MSEGGTPADVSAQICYEAVEQTADAVYITDTEGNIEYVNPAFEEITGYEEEEVLGKTPSILNSGEHDDSFYEDLWQTITAGERWETEIIDETKYGDQIVLDQTISPVATDDDEPRKFIAVARDITDRKQRERELERFKHIQSRVLRHNLRNRLSVIKAHAEDCSRELEREYATKAEHVLSEITELETLTSKTQTAERLLDQELIQIQFDLTERLRTLVEKLRDEFPDVSFRLECPSDCPIKAVPEVMLAFENLLDNAARHNDREQPLVEITLRDADTGAVVTIRDNGPGIPKQELMALEGDKETSLRHATGIGLWLVGWILKKDTASYTYETGETGTEFRVRFPPSSLL
jgi:PAS domain S-box-containing protein